MLKKYLFFLKQVNFSEKFLLIANNLFYKLLSFIPSYIKDFNNVLNNIYGKAEIKKVGIKNHIKFRIEEKEYNILLRRSDSDFLVFKQVIVDQEYKFIIDHFIKNNILPELILDCGANIGLTSIYLKHFYPNSKVYAFEIDKDNIALMKENFMMNNFNDINVIPKGIWDEETKLSISKNFRDHNSWSLNLTDVTSRSVTETLIETIRISKFIENNGIDKIDLIKMDVEGAEERIFNNEIELKKILPKVKAFAIEVHEEFISKKLVKDIMGNNNFDWYEAGETTLFLNKRFL